MAEEIQTTEVTKNSISNQGMLSNISNSLEKIKKFSNEPAVQRSIPVMITLFVFSRFSFFISFREPPRTTLFATLLLSTSAIAQQFAATGVHAGFGVNSINPIATFEM